MSALVRLSLSPAQRSGRVDGGWWPRTRDPVRELPRLLRLANRFASGPVAWLRLSWEDWDVHPDRVSTPAGAVPVGWNRLLLRHLLLARGGTGTLIVLLVVPADTDGPSARRALTLAADPRHTRLDARETMLHAGADHPDPVP